MTFELDDSTGFEDPVADTPAVTIAKEQNALAIAEDMDRVRNSLNEFDRVSAGLAELEARYPKDAIYPVETTKGMKDAVEHRAAWRGPRILVEKARKMAKAPLLALGKNIDARAAWITEQLEAGEQPVDQQIKAEEARREEERQRKAAAEAARVMRIQEALAEISQNVIIACGKTSADIRLLSEQMHATLPDPEVFQEMLPQAKEAIAAGIAKLETTLKAKLWEEAEAARIEQERAAEEQRRRDEAARLEAQRLENERVASEQAEAAARLAEERRKMEEELAALKAERDRIAQAEADRQTRVQARFDRYDELLTYDEKQASEVISTAITRVTANAPSVDTFGDRLAEAQKKHALVLEHLQAALPGALRREEIELTARLAAEAEEEAKAAAAREAIIPVAQPVAQVRQPEQVRTMTLRDINAAFDGVLTMRGEGMALLGFNTLPVKGPAKVYPAADFDRICNAIADHVHTVRARRAMASLEKAA